MTLRVKVTAGILEQYFGTMSVWQNTAPRTPHY